MSESEPRLVQPSVQYKASYLQATDEYLAEGLDMMWNYRASNKRFDAFLDEMASFKTNPPEGFVPASVFWLIVKGDIYAGEIDIRHRLNDSLKRYGGHMGYRIRRTQRRKGYGKLMCRLGILEARKLGIGDILITCDDDNIGSQKIIEANGGVLVDKVDNNRSVLSRRYWIYA